MENTIEEFDETLSLCDLPLYDQEIQPNNTLQFPNFPETHDFFEFSTSSSQSEADSSADNIIFCGKIISCKTDQVIDDCDNQRNFSNPLRKKAVSSNNSSNSLPRSKSFRCSSSGNSSRKHKVMVGLARIPSKMELSDLKERQNRRTPPPMFPAGVGCGEAVAISGGIASGRKGHLWGLLRPFRCSHVGHEALVA